MIRGCPLVHNRYCRRCIARTQCQSVRIPRFTAVYKLKIIADPDAGAAPGDVAALLRRKGLYSPNLAAWRAANRRSELTAPARRRSPKLAAPDPSAATAARRIVELERKLARATAHAERA